MRLSSLLWLTMWVVVARGHEPEATGLITQYHLQDSQGSFRYGHNTADQMARAEGEANSEMRGKYAYVDENGDMQAVEYTAGINGYLPRILNKEEAEASLLEPTIIQPKTEDIIPFHDHLIGTRYVNSQGALYNNKRGRDIEQMEETKQESEIRAIEKEAEETTQSEALHTTGNDEEKNKSDEKETIRGSYTFIQEDGLPATIEYEAGPEIGFVVKSFTKESLQSTLTENGSDAVYDRDGLNVRKENSPEKSIHIEEGTEETNPEGFVRGLYTFTDEDGIPATVEYEAGPKIGFVVKKFTKGDVKLDQGKGTSFKTNSVLIPINIPEDSSEGESIKFNINNNEKHLESLTEDHSSSNSRPEVTLNKYQYQDDDSAHSPSFTTDLYYQQNNTKIKNVELDDMVEQPDEEEEKEIPMNAAYRFGYSVRDQSRHEEADTLGNVHGNYSYVDGAGLLTKIEYEAGAKKGFVIKRMTHEHTKDPKTSPNNEIHHTENLSLAEKDNKNQESFIKEENNIRKKTGTEKEINLNQQEFNNRREHLDVTNMGGYDVSPYVLREYVDERNLPLSIGKEVDTESKSLNKDSTVASGSTKHFIYANPESIDLNSDGSYNYHRSRQTSDAHQQHNFPQETNTGLSSNHYSIFYRDPNDSGNLHETPTIKSYKHSSNLPYTEHIPENNLPYEIVLSKEMESYRTDLKPGFSVYGLPLISQPATTTSSDVDNTKKVVVHKQKPHQKRKKIVKHPTHMTNAQNIANIQPDGSYAFAYRAKDHSREQSVDRNGNVHLRYQIKTKRDGNTLVIFSTQVPINLLSLNDEVSLNQEIGKDYYADSKEYLGDHSVDKPYYLHETINPPKDEFSAQQRVSRDFYNIPNRKVKLVRRGFFRKGRSNINATTTFVNKDSFLTPSVNVTESRSL